MKLLNTSTLELEEYYAKDIPLYAILSHRWRQAETSYQDLLAGKVGEKVRRFCQLALDDGWQYVWIDTCCIDKKSSAELSEAINSMYQFYQRASVCCAYLDDVEDSESFHKSSWWTRGWTLQELLAPSDVIFYDKHWKEIGTKKSLSERVYVITGIREAYLLSCREVRAACVAEKMFWAAKRETTREEDIAYCLLGLFDVNMPLLYGEGQRAFLRLQHEIIRTSSDESIFAWGFGGDSRPRPVFAPSPSEFTTSGKILVIDGDDERRSYAMTNLGLRAEPLLLVSGREAVPLQILVNASMKLAVLEELAAKSSSMSRYITGPTPTASSWWPTASLMLLNCQVLLGEKSWHLAIRLSPANKNSYWSLGVLPVFMDLDAPNPGVSKQRKVVYLAEPWNSDNGGVMGALEPPRPGYTNGEPVEWVIDEALLKTFNVRDIPSANISRSSTRLFEFGSAVSADTDYDDILPGSHDKPHLEKFVVTFEMKADGPSVDLQTFKNLWDFDSHHAHNAGLPRADLPPQARRKLTDRVSAQLPHSGTVSVAIRNRPRGRMESVYEVHVRLGDVNRYFEFYEEI